MYGCDIWKYHLSSLESTPSPSIGQTVLKSDPDWGPNLQTEIEGGEWSVYNQTDEGPAQG
ncbi:hypothetical protein A2U01_0108126, partial [Trifolium medium]|nr:hypothetical protein [Trifolium medium]